MQGHIFYAQLCGFSRALSPSTPPQASTTEVATDNDESLHKTALDHLAQARALLEKYPSTAVLMDEIDAVENMLNDGVYRPVTTEELRAIYHTMAGDWRGTGHWYNCQNGHPFTIGECGMPMEEARCPECDAPIGGRSHAPVQGMRYAAEIEQMARGIGRLGM